MAAEEQQGQGVVRRSDRRRLGRLEPRDALLPVAAGTLAAELVDQAPARPPRSARTADCPGCPRPATSARPTAAPPAPRPRPRRTARTAGPAPPRTCGANSRRSPRSGARSLLAAARPAPRAVPPVRPRRPPGTASSMARASSATSSTQKPGQRFLRLGERPVSDHHLAVHQAHRLRRARVGQAVRRRPVRRSAPPRRGSRSMNAIISPTHSGLRSCHHGGGVTEHHEHVLHRFSPLSGRRAARRTPGVGAAGGFSTSAGRESSRGPTRCGTRTRRPAHADRHVGRRSHRAQRGRHPARTPRRTRKGPPVAGRPVRIVQINPATSAASRTAAWCR